MKWRRRLVVGITAVLAGAFAAHAQTAPQPAQPSVGDFYDLGNYDYFGPQAVPQPTPVPTPTSIPAATKAPKSVQSAPTTTTSGPSTQREASAAQAAPSAPVAPAAAVPVTAAEQRAAGAPYVYGIGDMAKAKADAKALAVPARSAAAGIPTTPNIAATVPGYSPTPLPQEAYADDPDALTSSGTSAALSSDAWKMVTNPDRTIVKLAPGEIARARDIEKDPNSFLDGQSLAAADGSCKPLPGTSATDYYEATCNKGAQVIQKPQTCSIRMVPVVVDTERFFYYGVPANQTAYGFASTTVLGPKVSAGLCRVEPVAKQICDAQVEMGAGGSDVAAYLKFCRKNVRGNAQQYSCSAEIPAGEIPDHRNYATGTVYLKKEGTKEVTVKRDDAACAALSTDATCTADGAEVCTEGPETRIIDGVPVTQSCWAWTRGFTCQSITQNSDCTDLESNGKCSFLRDECLDDPQSGPCHVSNKVYKCPVPAAVPSGDKQYICGDDVYCINGDCEPVIREASTEFEDAVVGLHVLGQANAEFDDKTLTLFSGERTGCHKPVFGLVNCCAGKSSGLITAVAGGAALIAGPAAIAALATPFLTTFLCSAEEKTLDVKDRMGLCHNLGSYCSQKILFVCTTKRTMYCCFESKLTRILQEQGRPQIGKKWDEPKKETCKGFSIDEFARLDLSVMDFTEVYAEFVDAAKLPDEVATAQQIQERIRAYYEQHGQK